MAQLHEYQGKKIFQEYGIEIPRGEVARTAEEARQIAENIGGEVVVKAQIHSTSRAAQGGIKFAKNADEAFAKAQEIFANLNAEAVLVDEKAEIEREFYLGFIIDDRLKRPTLLFSDSGGSGIEERAETMKKLVCSIRREPLLEEIKAISNNEKIAEILQKLYRAAKATDARTSEINPLALLKDGRLVALDARISVDDYAVFRHENLGIDIARELGHPPTKLERIAWEVEKEDFRGTFYFVQILPKVESGESRVGSRESRVESQESGVEKEPPTLDSPLLTLHSFPVGFHGAGGGGSMASLDAAQRNGLQPVCYVDTSGNPPASKVYRAAKIILSMPDIRGYFLSGSGVASQEQFSLARAVLKAFREVLPTIPAVLRLGGNGEDLAKSLVEKYSQDLPAPVEAYQKQHSADFCAKRLYDLIQEDFPQSRKDAKDEGQRTKDKGLNYSFKTRTGEITFNYEDLDKNSSMKIVESCPQKILSLNENSKPVLNISEEEAVRGKCSECLACEFAAWDLGLENAVEIEFPIEGLNN